MTLHAGQGAGVPGRVHARRSSRACCRTSAAWRNDEDVEEERRLCFVGMTRAKKELYLCHARLREFRGQMNYAIPSSFLNELPRDGVEHRRPVDGAQLRPHRGRRVARRSVGPAARDWADTGARPVPPARRRPPNSGPRSPTRRKPAWRSGVLVQHEEYGIGTVTDLSGFGALRRVKIRFARPGREDLHRGQGEAKSGGAEEGVSHRLYGLGVASALGFDFNPDGVDGDHAVGVLLAGLRLRVGELHRHERLRGRVAVLQVLEDRAAERVLALLGHVREDLAVALDDEARQPAFEVGLGFPGQLVALARARSSARAAASCR